MVLLSVQGQSLKEFDFEEAMILLKLPTRPISLAFEASLGGAGGNELIARVVKLTEISAETVKAVSIYDVKKGPFAKNTQLKVCLIQAQHCLRALVPGLCKIKNTIST